MFDIRTRRTWNALLRVGFAVGLASLLPSCASIKPQSSDLATTGATTMGAIADYYTLLQNASEQQVRDTFVKDALESLAGQCKQDPGSADCAPKAMLEKMRDIIKLQPATRQAITARRDLALAMQSLYTKFGTMSQVDLESAFGTQGESIGKAINAVNANAVPASLIGDAFKALAVSVENHTLGQGEIAIRSVLIAFTKQFLIELPAWNTKFESRDRDEPIIVERMLQMDFASYDQLNDRMIQAYSLQNGSKSMSSVPLTRSVLVGWALLESNRLTDDTRNASISAKRALEALVAAHEGFPKTDGLATALDATARLTAIVGDWEDWKKARADAASAAAAKATATTP